MVSDNPTAATDVLHFSDDLGFLGLYHQVCVGYVSQLLTHEFNNALTSLGGYAQMALSIKREAVMIKAAQHFVDTTAHLQELVHYVHAFSPAQTRELGPVAPKSSAQSAQKILGQHLSKRNIELTIGEQPARTVSGNQALLTAGLITFVLDARDRILSRGASGRIGLDLQDSGESVCLRLSDSSGLPSVLAAPVEAAARRIAGARSPLQELAPLAFHAVAAVHGGRVLSPAGPGEALAIELPVCRLTP